MAIHGFNPGDRRLGYVRVETEHDLVYFLLICEHKSLCLALDKGAEGWFCGTNNNGALIRFWLPAVVGVEAYHPAAIAALIENGEESQEESRKRKMFSGYDEDDDD